MLYVFLDMPLLISNKVSFIENIPLYLVGVRQKNSDVVLS